MTRYLELDELLEVVESVTGWGAVRDEGLLLSALERPRMSVFGRDAYPTLYLKAAALLHSLARNHALVDGNKRTGWLACRAMLRLNGVDLRVQPDLAVPFVEAIAEGDLEVEDIAKSLTQWAQAGR